MRSLYTFLPPYNQVVVSDTDLLMPVELQLISCLNTAVFVYGEVEIRQLNVNIAHERVNLHLLSLDLEKHYFYSHI